MPAAPGSYAWYVGTLVDGRITHRIPVMNTSWQDVMDDAGTLSAVMPLADRDVAALRPYVIAEPCRCFLAVAYTDVDATETFLAAGPIWTHSYDDATRELTIGAAGAWSYYDHRKVLPVLAPGVNPATATSTYTTLSLATIAKRLVQLAHTHTAGALPIVVPSDEAGTEQRTYPGYEMNVVGQMLRNLTGVENGPEIQFVPQRNATDPRFLEWRMRTGTIAQPQLFQAGADWIWDASVVKGSVSAIKVNRDGTAMGTRAWVQGSGADVGTLFARADDTTLTAAGFPLLEVQESGHDNDTVQATLDAEVAGLLARSLRPVETWTFTVRRDDVPKVSSYAVGDWAAVTVADNHVYLPAGTYRARILSRSGDDGPDIDVQLSPTPGGI